MYMGVIGTPTHKNLCIDTWNSERRHPPEITL